MLWFRVQDLKFRVSWPHWHTYPAASQAFLHRGPLPGPMSPTTLGTGLRSPKKGPRGFPRVLKLVLGLRRGSFPFGVSGALLTDQGAPFLGVAEFSKGAEGYIWECVEIPKSLDAADSLFLGSGWHVKGVPSPNPAREALRRSGTGCCLSRSVSPSGGGLRIIGSWGTTCKCPVPTPSQATELPHRPLALTSQEPP